jgi:hypothetical protein
MNGMDVQPAVAFNRTSNSMPQYQVSRYGHKIATITRVPGNIWRARVGQSTADFPSYDDAKEFFVAAAKILP